VPISSVRRAFVILGVVACTTALGLAFAQDQEVLKLQSAVAAEDPGAPEYLAALVGAAVTVGNTYDVLTNGDQAFPAMLDAIHAATRRISFETYVYEKGHIADEFTRALADAAHRGVIVSIVMDSVGSFGIDGAQVKLLRQAGCHLATFHPTRWYAMEDVNYRTHRKILVVDGQVGFTGGIGVADQWLGHAQDADHWRDTQIRMRGPIVRFLEAVFYENFAEAAGVVLPVLDEVAPDPQRLGQSMLVSSSPTGGSNELKRLYLLAIAMARRSIDIVTPYFVMDESSRWALEQAARRGVKVRVLVEGDITDAKPVKYASREAYDWLLSLGIEIFEYQPTMMHAKVMVVDEIWSMFGSANFDNRSLELNDELNIAVTSRGLAARFLQDFQKDLGVATRLDRESWQHRSRLEKGRERFWSYFGELF
jgi:cardiolipin synthase